MDLGMGMEGWWWREIELGGEGCDRGLGDSRSGYLGGDVGAELGARSQR